MTMKNEDRAFKIRRMFEQVTEFNHWGLVQDEGNNYPSLECYSFKTPPVKFSFMQSSLYRIKWTWRGDLNGNW